MSTGKGPVLCGWEGNRRSDVALAMRHRLCIICCNLQAQWVKEGRWAPRLHLHYSVRIIVLYSKWDRRCYTVASICCITVHCFRIRLVLMVNESCPCLHNSFIAVAKYVQRLMLVNYYCKLLNILWITYVQLFWVLSDLLLKRPSFLEFLHVGRICG